MVVDFSANQTEATVIEMYPSTYNIRMFAQNSLGTSKASNILTITTREAGAVILLFLLGLFSLAAWFLTPR